MAKSRLAAPRSPANAHRRHGAASGYPAALAYMAAYGVPGQLLPLAIAAELGCGAGAWSIDAWRKRR